MKRRRIIALSTALVLTGCNTTPEDQNGMVPGWLDNAVAEVEVVAVEQGAVDTLVTTRVRSALAASDAGISIPAGAGDLRDQHQVRPRDVGRRCPVVLGRAGP